MSAGRHPGGLASRNFTAGPKDGATVRHRPRRVVRWLARAAGVGVTVAVTLVVVALLGLDTPLGRAWVAKEVNGVLAPSFRGRIHVDRLGALGLFGVAGTDVTVFDPDERPVLVARGVRVRIATWAAIRSMLFARKGPLAIRLTDVGVDDLDARLDTDPQGQLVLLDAFAPREATTQADPSARGLRLDVVRLGLRHARMHGQPAGAPDLDVDLNDFAGAVTYAPDGLEGDISRLAIVVHRIVNGSDIDGSLRAHIVKPADPDAKPRAHLDWQGVAAGIPHSLHAVLDQDHVDATVDAPHIDPADVRAVWSSSPIDRPGQIHVEAHGILPDVRIALNAALGKAVFDATGAIRLGDPKRANLSFSSHDLDIHEFVASVPASRVGFTGDATATSKADGGLSGDLSLHFLGGRVGTDDVPRATLSAVLERPTPTALRGHADVTIDEPSAPTHLRLDVFPGDHGSIVAFDLTSNVAELDRVPELRHAAQGAAHVEAKGSLDAARMTVDAQVHARLARIVQGATRVGAASFDGRAHGAVSAPDFDVALRSQQIVAAGLHVATADVAASGRPDAAHLRASVRGPDVPSVDGNVEGLAADMRLELKGRAIAGNVHATLGASGSIDVDAPKIEVPGNGPLSVASWKDAWGTIAIDAKGDLARASQLLPPDDMPFDEARGDVAVKARVTRDGPGRMPDIDFSVSTTNLAIAPRRTRRREIDGVVVLEHPSWRIEGVDFDVEGKMDGRAGSVHLSTRAHDVKGALADLRVSSDHVDYRDLVGGSGRLMSKLRATPFDIRVDVPERGLGGLPDLLKQSYVSGRFQGHMSVTGTLASPALDVAATLKDSRVARDGKAALPLDFDVTAHYDGRKGAASVKARTGAEETLDLQAEIEARAAQWLEAAGSPAWKASAHAQLSKFPLQAFAVLDDKQVAGDLSGTLAVVDLHDNARLDGTLAIDGLKVGGVAYKTANVKLKADGQTLDGQIRLDQNDGFVQVSARATTSWGARLAPALDPSRPVDVALASRNFRIGSLLPFVESTFDEFDGRLDTDARLELDPRTRRARLSGKLVLSQGTLEAVAGGGELHDVVVKVRFLPDGTIAVDQITASGLTGRVDANGSARLDGTQLVSARGVLTIPARAGMPISAGGAEIGTVDGRFEIDETSSAGGMGVRVDVPHLRVVLPDGSTSDAMALGPMDRIRVGAHRGVPSAFTMVPLDPVAASSDTGPASAHPLTIETNLSDVQVVRGTDIQIGLGGKVKVTTGAATDVTGQIHLKRGGLLAVQGRNFSVESGTVTLVGSDPSNPEVVVKAGWHAPDGTVVYANFVGPLKTGKVTLTSEPQLPEAEIVELLQFGSADGQQAQSPSADPSTSAIGTVGGEAAQPLNHMLNQLGLGAVSAKVDTSESENPKPEVEVQIARDISLQIAVVLGQPPPGVNPDVTLLTVDWRFLDKWSLASTLGNAGTTIFDLLWQKRY
jgi:autotransporter translocation and assembly factor TamB